ncbi:hypothetical protein GF362_01225 [Candidatus Dojkabacteria bacterium]|nr:hypothetical protein [Candidatus Dojkabacteria bacterium]
MNKKNTKLTKEEKMKLASKQWVVLCLEMLGYSDLIPKENNTTSAVNQIKNLNNLYKYISQSDKTGKN